ncbi:MAG: phage tail tape measure protein [Chloroflexi bacterium]|nr:phage tail tape measure protein [Chloroflexota bacterium]
MVLIGAGGTTLPVTIDSRGAVIGAGLYNKAQISMVSSTERTQRSMKKLLGVMAAFAVLKSVTKVIADFELVMRQVEGVTGQTEKQMRVMIKTARELGATTQFSATQAGEGLLFLSRAGFSAADAMKALPEEQRRVVELSYFGGFTQVEISEMTGQPLGTVKTRMRLALKKLRASLANRMTSPER